MLLYSDFINYHGCAATTNVLETKWANWKCFHFLFKGKIINICIYFLLVNISRTLYLTCSHVGGIVHWVSKTLLLLQWQRYDLKNVLYVNIAYTTAHTNTSVMKAHQIIRFLKSQCQILLFQPWATLHTMFLFSCLSFVGPVLSLFLRGRGWMCGLWISAGTAAAQWRWIKAD